MKTANLLTLLAFVLAIGTALASETFVSDAAWTHIDDVPDQTSTCEQRLTCPGGSVTCKLSFQIGETSYQDIPAYNGINPTTGNCGTLLQMNP